MRPTAGSARSLEPLGIKVAYTPLGIFVALVFIGLPFVVRTRAAGARGPRARDRGGGRHARRRPLADLVPGDAADASSPALLTGFALAFARAVGEYGSVIFIAGNIPLCREIAPLLIIIRLEEFDYAGATAIATVMLLIAFVLLLIINLLQVWTPPEARLCLMTAQRRPHGSRAARRGSLACIADRRRAVSSALFLLLPLVDRSSSRPSARASRPIATR